MIPLVESSCTVKPVGRTDGDGRTGSHPAAIQPGYLNPVGGRRLEYEASEQPSAGIFHGWTRMISPIVIAEVDCLLREESHSHAEIARMTGVSRSTVSDVRSGKRPVRPVLPDAEQPTSRSVPKSRCPKCGSWSEIAWDRWMCRACRTRRGKRRRIYDEEGSVKDLALDLQPEHAERYATVMRKSGLELAREP